MAVQFEHLWQKTLLWICFCQLSWLEQLQIVSGILVNKHGAISVWSCWCRESYSEKTRMLLFPPSLPMASLCLLHLPGVWAALVGEWWLLPKCSSSLLGSLVPECMERFVVQTRSFRKSPCISDGLDIWGDNDFFNVSYNAFEFLSGRTGQKCDLMLWMGGKPKVKPFHSSLGHPGFCGWTSYISQGEFVLVGFLTTCSLFRAGLWCRMH